MQVRWRDRGSIDSQRGGGEESGGERKKNKDEGLVLVGCSFNPR